MCEIHRQGYIPSTACQTSECVAKRCIIDHKLVEFYISKITSPQFEFKRIML